MEKFNETLPKLDGSDVRVYMVLFLAIKGDRNTVTISYREIGKRSGIGSHSTLTKAISALEDHQLVEVLIEGKFRGSGRQGHAATYKLLF